MIKELIGRQLFEGFSSMNLQKEDVFLCLLFTVIIEAYVFMIYRIMNRNAFYNKGFHVSLLVIGVITAAIILTIQSSIVVSLGMVGALSIVRFRTAIKDPMDLAFLFWSISVGIICGAGYTFIAIVASLVITVIMIILKIMPTVKTQEILVVNANEFKKEKEILDVIKRNCSLSLVKSRNVSKDHMDMAIEIRTRQQNQLINELMDLEGVISASIVSYNGDATF